jgi:hypothetical protein
MLKKLHNEEHHNLRFSPNIKKNSGASVRQQTTPIERPPLVGEVNTNF